MRKRLFESLGTRVVAMLSIALLPVGLISLYQTSHVIDQADELVVIVGSLARVLGHPRDLTCDPIPSCLPVNMAKPEAFVTWRCESSHCGARPLAASVSARAP